MAMSVDNFDTEMKPLEDAYKKAKLANDILMEGFQEKLEQLEHDIANLGMDEDEIELERQKLDDEYEKVLAQMEANQSERDEFEEKFWKSEHSFPEEFASEYKIKTLDKSLIIYQNISLLMLSKKSGDDFLTGYQVWDSACVLAKYLEVSCANKSWIRGKKILDLGAGTGYLGIVAACLGGDVTVADLAPMMPFLQKNIDANFEQLQGTGGQIHTQIIRWGDEGSVKSLPKYDIILLSGVVYRNELVEPLISTVVALSDKRTKLIVCQDKWSDRMKKFDPWDAFYSQASKYFKLSPIQFDAVLPNGDAGYDDVWLLRGDFR